MEEVFREQMTFSNSHTKIEERLVVELLAPRPVPFVTPGSLRCPLSWPGLNIPKPWKTWVEDSWSHEPLTSETPWSSDLNLIHFLVSWEPRLRSTQPLISLLWNSTLRLITGIPLNNKSIYYLLATYYVPGIGISTDVFHLILIKALLSD